MPGESFDDLFLRTVEREARRRRAPKIIDSLDELHEQIRDSGLVQTDSTQLIRDLREGVGHLG